MDKKFKIQDYILEDQNEPEKEEKKAAVKVRPKYEVLFQDGADFVVSRKTKTTEDELVILASQKQFYIKKLKGKKGVAPLTALTMANFTKDLEEDLPLPDTYYECLPEDSQMTKTMFSLLTVEDGIIAEACQNGVYYLSSELLSYMESWNTPEQVKSYICNRDVLKTTRKYETYKKLFKIVCDEKGIDPKALAKEFTLDVFRNESGMNSLCGTTAVEYVFSVDSLRALEENFGYGGVRDFLKMILGYGYTVPTNYRSRVDLQSLFMVPTYESNSYSYWNRRYGADSRIKVEYKAKDFFEYLTYQSYIQGFTPSDFVQYWSDTLSMEIYCFGKITEKYPKNLASLHQKLQTESRIRQNAKEKSEYDNLISLRRGELPSYSEGNISITPAESRDEILRIASMFNNCLAGYVDRYANKATDIYFMYRGQNPEVAIEINNGKLRQAYQARNERPNKKQLDIIRNFCEANEFGFTTDYHPM